MDSRTAMLIYGAGPLGSLFAARLQQGGNDVSILARGQRLTELCELGIVGRGRAVGQKPSSDVALVWPSTEMATAR